jgi:2-oxoglutarate dehydrogenase E2 component (dihydrolipoamide succinyltransferase)
MKIDVKMPKMGESILEGTVGALLKPEGSFVKEGEGILEIETEKVNQLITAPASGTVSLKVKTGDAVKIDQLLATIDSEGTGVSAPTPQRAAPAVAAPAPVTAPSTGRETRQKLSKVRQVIASRLVQVKNETAMLTTFNEVDMTKVMAIRTAEQQNFQQKHGVKLGFMSFFVKACLSALKEYPAVNARIEGDEIVYQNFYDIGIAVGTDKGLFVPVIRNADQLSYADIEKTIAAYAEKAKTGAITLDEMQGGTFTITNGGVYGSMLSTPILNPPQSGILGMHNIVKRAVVIDDQIAIRPIMYLALSYDHRIVDGKESIGFLLQVKKFLENPVFS